MVAIDRLTQLEQRRRGQNVTDREAGAARSAQGTPGAPSRQVYQFCIGFESTKGEGGGGVMPLARLLARLLLPIADRE